MEGTPNPASELTLLQRVWGIFVAPRVVFRYLDLRPRVLGALLILIVVHIVLGFLLSDIAFEEQAVRLEERTDLTEEQLEQSRAAMEFMKAASPFLAALAPLFSVYVIGGLLYLFANFVLKGQGTYKHYVSAMAHIGLVVIPMSLIRVPLILSRGEMDVPLSLAALLGDADKEGTLYKLLNQFDFFGLWQLGLAVVAVAVLGRMSTQKAAVSLIGLWLIWILIWTPLSNALPS